MLLGRRRGVICICKEVIGLSTELHSIAPTDTSTSCLFILKLHGRDWSVGLTKPAPPFFSCSLTSFEDINIRGQTSQLWKYASYDAIKPLLCHSPVIQDPGINMPRKKGRSQRKKAIRAKNRVQNQAAALYEPLDSKRREIRIAKLNPGDFSDDIRCTLFKVSLDDNPQYQALSYVWGDPGVTRQISLNGSPYQVTESLEIALRHLRLPSEERILWVDAICINQRDVPERNVQVRHMGSVYETASKVIAWLGEESGDSNLAFDAFEALPKDEKLHWDPEKNQHFEDKFLQRKYISAMKQIFRRPWWRRLWTAQESILGPSLEFTCGHRCISAESLFALANSWFIHRRSCCSGYLRRNLDLENFSNYMVLIDDLRFNRQEKSEHGLLSLLMNYRSRECADPRDKIYGLLGLCPDHEQNSIIPDYSAPISRVYEDVT
jgi:hypothetical protein